MQLIKKVTATNGYDEDDVLIVRDDSHQWSARELDSSIFTIETGQTVSQEDISLIRMQDEAPENFSAISQLPTFRSLSTRRENLHTLHRRKYQWSGGQATLKANAQER